MRKNYTFAFLPLLCLWTSVNGQTLDQSNSAPTVGDNWTYYMGTYQDPSPGGSGQTWDFFDLYMGQSANSNYVTPASTGHGSTFPTANVAGSDGTGGYVFLLVNNTGVSVVGAYSSAASAALPYQNPEKVMSYPLSYNGTWTDAFSSNFTISGIDFARSGNISGEADATGTLIMPYGTVNNVIRVRTAELFTDVSDFYTVEYDYVNYSYYKPGVRAPLYQSTDAVTTVDGSPTESQVVRWTTMGTVGIFEAVNNDIGIDVFPNPATDQLSVTFSSTGEDIVIEMIDAIGRVAYREDVGAMAVGVGTLNLALDRLVPGSYALKITTASGQQGTKRVVVQ